MKRLILLLALWAAPALADLPQADVYVLGEVHDNPGHHLRQADWIDEIAPTAVVFEMLSTDQADLINETGQADPDALEWADSGWPDFALYAPVFEAAISAEIGGGNIARAVVRRAMSEDLKPLFAELWGEAFPDAPVPNFGLDTPLPDQQQSDREAGQLAAHCDALPVEMLPGFVAAQRLRDAALAAAVLAALNDGAGPVVVITGNGHARKDWGVPALLAQAAPHLRVLSVGQFEDEAPLDAPFDVTATSPAAAREDPCLAFR